MLALIWITVQLFILFFLMIRWILSRIEVEPHDPNYEPWEDWV